MASKPFSTGDRVSVVRTQHGWYDGSLEATVVHRDQRPSGTWHYRVRDGEGNEHEVRHTRDMRPAGG